jgi:hypothetical protein
MIFNLHPKCANPSCAAAFGWMTGGKLFRFHRGSKEITLSKTNSEVNGSHSHPIEHFWLCERCSNIYTLNYEPGRGVTIFSLWPQLAEAKSNMHLPSS